jgi:hypothetical protein
LIKIFRKLLRLLLGLVAAAVFSNAVFTAVGLTVPSLNSLPEWFIKKNPGWIEIALWVVMASYALAISWSPASVFVLISELKHVRDWISHVFWFAISSASFMLGFSVINAEYASMIKTAVLSLLVGASAGFAYWLVSGRRAGS